MVFCRLRGEPGDIFHFDTQERGTDEASYARIENGYGLHSELY